MDGNAARQQGWRPCCSQRESIGIGNPALYNQGRGREEGGGRYFGMGAVLKKRCITNHNRFLVSRKYPYSACWQCAFLDQSMAYILFRNASAHKGAHEGQACRSASGRAGGRVRSAARRC